MSRYKFDYNICTVADEKVFARLCKTLEKRIPNLVKGQLLEDVDGGQYQHYTLDGKEIVAKNSYYIDAVFVESDVDLEKYLIGEA